MQKNLKRIAGSVLAASITLAFALGAGASAAQSPVKLRFSHTVPETDSQHKAALEFSKRV